VSAIAHAPYGYRYVSKQEGQGEARWDVIREQARVVKAIFAWVALEGLSLSEVVRRLADEGVPTATGQPRWDRATVRGILTHPAYTGHAKYPKTKLFPRPAGRRPKRGDPATPRRAKTPRPASPEEQDTIAVPALVSEELFAAAGERLEENRRRYRQQKQGAEFLLSGLLVCGRCGSAYCGRRQRSRHGDGAYVYYRCLGTDKYRHGGEALCANASLNGARLEEAVWSDVCALLQDPGRLRREFERRLERAPQEPLEATQRTQAVAQLKRRITRLIDAYENGLLEKHEFQPRMAAAKERLAREEAALAQQERDLSRAEELRLVVGCFESFAKQIATNLDHADFATRRKLLRLLVHRIEVAEDEVRLVYKVQPHPFVLRPARGFLQDCLKSDSPAQGRAAHPGLAASRLILSQL
jgi:site-specific DNA recombinase